MTSIVVADTAAVVVSVDDTVVVVFVVVDVVDISVDDALGVAAIVDVGVEC